MEYQNATRSNPHHKTIQGSLYPTQSLILSNIYPVFQMENA